MKRRFEEYDNSNAKNLKNKFYEILIHVRKKHHKDACMYFTHQTIYSYCNVPRSSYYDVISKMEKNNLLFRIRQSFTMESRISYVGVIVTKKQLDQI